MPVKLLWIVLAVGGMGAYILIAVLTDREALMLGVRSLGAAGVAFVLSCSLLNYALRFMRWNWYLRLQGWSVPRSRHALYYLAGFALTVTPGKAGEAIRSLYLRQHGVPYADSLAMLFVERFVDFVGIVMLAAVFLLHSPEYRFLAVLAIVLLTGFFVAVASGVLSRLLTTLARRLPARPAKMLQQAADLFDSSRSLMSGKRLAIAVIIGLVAWGAEGYGLFVVTHALKISVDVGDAIAIYAGSVLAGALAFFMPGGVGGTEVVMTALLVERGSALGVAVVATLFCRLATLWFAVVLGLLAMLALHGRPIAKRAEGLS